MTQKFLSEAWYQAERENAVLRSKCRQEFWDSLGITPARDLTDIAPLSDPVGNMRALIEKTAAGREQDSSVRECLAMAQGPLSLFTSPLLIGRATTPTPSCAELQPYCFQDFFINDIVPSAWLTQDKIEKADSWPLLRNITSGGTAPDSNITQGTTTNTPFSDGMGTDFTTGTHADQVCIYEEHLLKKFYEYAAMAQMVYELSTDAELREQVVKNLETNVIAKLFRSLFYYNESRTHFDQSMGHLGLSAFGIEGGTEGFDETRRKGEEVAALSRQEFVEAVDQIGAAFSELWEEIRKRFTDCGWLYGAATLLTDAGLIAGEVILGVGVAKAAKEILKSVKLVVTITKSGLYRTEVILLTSGETLVEKTFAEEMLAKSFGTPQDHHAGTLTKNPNRAPTPERSTHDGKKPDKPDEPDSKTAAAGTQARRLTNKQIGDAAEKQAKKDLVNEGFTPDNIYEIKNDSDNGVDLIGVDWKTGKVRVIEVKANTAGLSKAQENLGGPAYTLNRLKRARDNEGWYRKIGTNPDGTDIKEPSAKHAKEILELISKDKRNGTDKVKYEIWKYKVDPVNGNAEFKGYDDWGWEKGKKPGRLYYRAKIWSKNNQGTSKNTPLSIALPYYLTVLDLFHNKDSTIAKE